MRGNQLDPLLSTNGHYLQPVAKAVAACLAINVTATTFRDLRERSSERRINLELQIPATQNAHLGWMLQPSKETSSQWRSESPNKDQSQRGGVDEHGLLLVHKSVGLHIIGGLASQQISPLLEQLPLSELLV